MPNKKGEQKLEVRPTFSVDFKQQIIPQFPDEEKKEYIDIKYPLIPPYAYAHIFWEDQNKELVYFVEEPVLNKAEENILQVLEDGIKELINISYIAVKSGETVIEYLEKNINILIDELQIEISKESYLKIMYFIYRDFVGLNEIEPMLNDYFIEDIECNGIGYPIYIVHRKYRNLRTNITYKDADKLALFVEKLAQKCGQYISYATPLLDGSLPDGSRVNATFTEDISSRGPTFTVRKFTKNPWTPTKLMQLGTISPQMLAYLWILIEYETNIMIVGGTGSGKTTFLNALTFFIPPQARVVSIEDTRELNLDHENWLPAVSREGVGLVNLVGQKYGEVSLFDLLRESFRQNPDYVIIGEVRGKEAYVLFQGMASIKGDEEIFVIKDNKPSRIKIQDLKEIKNVSTITYDLEKKQVNILPIKAIIKHPSRETLYKITTKTGREVTLTPDHSLFKYQNNIVSAPMESLKIGDKILIPSRIPCAYADLDHIDLLEFLPNARVYAPILIKEAVSKIGYSQACTIVGVQSISDYYSDFTRSKPSYLKVDKFLKLVKETNIDYTKEDIKIKFDKKSEMLPSKLKITSEFLRLLGYYLSEGSLNIGYKSNRISLYNKNKEILKDMECCIINVTSKSPTKRQTKGFGEATELSFNHKVIYEFLDKYCGKKHDKKIPDFIFGLSKEKIGNFLSALYDGDGSFTKNYFGYYTISKKFADDLSKLLLVFGIVARINKRNRLGRETTDYEILFYHSTQKNEFLKHVKSIKNKFSDIQVKQKNNKKILGDLYIDEIRSIEIIKLDKKEPVYDIAVPGTRNFIGGFGGILLHNSGHPSFGTMHANSVETLIRRLETPPINLSSSLVETLDAVCVMIQTKIKGEPVRRIREISEIISVKEGFGGATINNPFIWNPQNDTFLFKSDSYVFKKLTLHHGVTREELFKELEFRAKLLVAMYKKGIFGFKEVRATVNEYYKDPKYALKKFGVI